MENRMSLKEVKGILDEAYGCVKSPLGINNPEMQAQDEFNLNVALQICQLFPPYLKALWTDKEGQCFWCKQTTHWLDVCYEGYVCSQKCQEEIAEDAKSRVGSVTRIRPVRLEPKHDETRLKGGEDIVSASSGQAKTLP